MLHPDLFIFSLPFGSFSGNQRYQTSHKTILNCFVRQSATSRFIYILFVIRKFPLVTSATKPLTKQYSIVLFGRVLHPDLFIFSLPFGIPFGNQRYPKLLPRRGVLFPKLPVSLNSTNVDTVQNLTLMCPQDFVIYNLDSIDTLQILSPKILLSNETNLLTC